MNPAFPRRGGRPVPLLPTPTAHWHACVVCAALLMGAEGGWGECALLFGRK